MLFKLFFLKKLQLDYVYIFTYISIISMAQNFFKPLRYQTVGI